MDADDFDMPWKEVVMHHFPEFMAFYFPFAHAAIDWSRPHTFLDQEFGALTRDAELPIGGAWPNGGSPSFCINVIGTSSVSSICTG
ncbi:hypothetical protein RugamoR57_25370 [Duganella caerulea]|uniref:hypothetical protein n=1 Tax=Duganella caerulea TaxID=2885762 RepID=UPI0030E9FDAC